MAKQTAKRFRFSSLIYRDFLVYKSLEIVSIVEGVKPSISMLHKLAELGANEGLAGLS